jgi:hypothetical protein
MNLRQMIGRPVPVGGAEEKTDPGSAERCLTLLVDGVAANTPEVDPDFYRLFRAKVDRLSHQIPDRLPEDDKIALIKSILQEFEYYRKNADDEIRDRRAAWRTVVKSLLHEVLASLGVDSHAPDAELLFQQIMRMESAIDIKAWFSRMDNFLHPVDDKGKPKNVGSPLKVADRSNLNDNAAGLRGGGAAVEYLRLVMERGGDGFVVIFRLSCLDVVNQRFGMDAVQDCVMEISAFLTAGLQSADAIFHWSDSALMAIVQGRLGEQIMTAELQRLISRHRESSITIGGRAIMLRVPIAFELTPISSLTAPEDLYRLPPRKAAF